MFKEVVDGVLFIEIYFVVVKGFVVGGIGIIKMKVYVRFVLYDKIGKKVFVFFEGVNFKKIGIIVGGVFVLSFDKVLFMCESVLEEFLKDFDEKLEKIVKKLDKF